MYYTKIKSFTTDQPICQKLEGGKDCYFVQHADIVRHYSQRDLDEQPVIDWVMNNFVKSDKVFVDIGAHIGEYSLQAARKAAHVHSFECYPKSFNYLCANIALQNLHFSIDTHRVALSNKEGVAQCQNRDNIQADGGGNGIVRFNRDSNYDVPMINVPMRTLDSYGLTNIGFIKIDVEGHEKQVLEGATETLRANHYPPFIFESWYPDGREDHLVPKTELRRELFEYIHSLGYVIHPIHGFYEIFLAVHP